MGVTKKNKRTLSKFNKYENLLCVFQTFNKSHLLKIILDPFIKAEFKNIILFSDGCIDNSATEAHALLQGKKHAVIMLNDLHEIHNYRFALTSEWGTNAEFALLMQDDDIYPDDFSWLNYGLEMMKKDPKLVVIGFNGGQNINQINRASDTFTSDTFIVNEGRYSLGDNVKGSIVRLPVFNQKFDFNYAQVAIRAPHLIRVKEFLKNTNFDPSFEPFQDDDTNYCLQLWSKGLRIGLVHGAKIFRDIGIGGMRLSNAMTITNRPIHTQKNHNLLFERYAEFINSGQCQSLVDQANGEIARPKNKLLYL